MSTTDLVTGSDNITQIIYFCTLHPQSRFKNLANTINFHYTDILRTCTCTFNASYPGDHLLHLRGYLPWVSSIAPSMLATLGIIYYTFKATYPGDHLSHLHGYLPWVSSIAPSRLLTLGVICYTFMATYPGDHLLHLHGYLPWGSSIAPSWLPTLGIIYCTYKATYPGDHLLHLQGYVPWGSSIAPTRLPTLGIICYTFMATYSGDHILHLRGYRYLPWGSSQSVYLFLYWDRRLDVCTPIGFDKSRNVVGFFKSNSWSKQP